MPKSLPWCRSTVTGRPLTRAWMRPPSCTESPTRCHSASVLPIRSFDSEQIDSQQWLLPGSCKSYPAAGPAVLNPRLSLEGACCIPPRAWTSELEADEGKLGTKYDIQNSCNTVSQPPTGGISADAAHAAQRAQEQGGFLSKHQAASTPARTT